MTRYMLIKHYRGGRASVNDVPMSQWTPEEFRAHLAYMDDLAERLRASGEWVDGQALADDGFWCRYDGEDAPALTDGPFAESKEVIAGWMAIDVASRERAVQVARELSAAPGAGGEPLGEWLEVRPFMDRGEVG